MEDNFEELKKVINIPDEIYHIDPAYKKIVCLAIKPLIERVLYIENEIADLKKKKKRDVFTPPTLQECIDYAKEKNMTNINVQDYWDARERTSWCLASGAKIKKWTLDMNLMNRKGYYANTVKINGSNKPNTDTARRNAGAIQEDNG